MTKYADVYKVVSPQEEVELFFNAVEVFDRYEEDYEILEVELVSIKVLGVEIPANSLTKKAVDFFLSLSDDNDSDWEYY